MKTKKETCNCKFCKTYRKYKWAVVMECPCGCHDGDGMTGHDSLCCEFPNGLRKNNPYKKLKSAEYYRNIIQEWKQSCGIQYILRFCRKYSINMRQIFKT